MGLATGYHYWLWQLVLLWAYAIHVAHATSLRYIVAHHVVKYVFDSCLPGTYHGTCCRYLHVVPNKNKKIAVVILLQDTLDGHFAFVVSKQIYQFTCRIPSTADGRSNLAPSFSEPMSDTSKIIDSIMQL